MSTSAVHQGEALGREAFGRAGADESHAPTLPGAESPGPSKILSLVDRALAPEWLPADWPSFAASVWYCTCGYLYRRRGSLVPRECVDAEDGAVHQLLQWKRCATCRHWKTRDGYSVNSNRSDRLKADCRDCRTSHEAAKQRRATHERSR